MKAPAALAVLAVLAALAATARPGTAAPAAEADKVRAVLLQQAALFKAGRWRAMYATYTPRYRARCPYAAWARSQRRLQQEIGTSFTVRNVRVRVTGTRALVAYRFVSAAGETIGAVDFADEDVYTRIRGRWLDEYDTVSSC